MLTLSVPTVPMKRRVQALEAAMIASPDQIDIEPRHFFLPGLYAREVTLPKGSTAVGHLHRQDHICIISKGRVQVVTETGVEEIAAPMTMTVPAGRKNCVHALEETVWTTIHATVATNPDEAEAVLIEKGDSSCPSLR